MREMGRKKGQGRSSRTPEATPRRSPGLRYGCTSQRVARMRGNSLCRKRGPFRTAPPRGCYWWNGRILKLFLLGSTQVSRS
jgi:hypothetical protein